MQNLQSETKRDAVPSQDTEVSACFDSSMLEAQLLDLKSLLETKLPNDFIGDLSSLALDVVVGNDVATLGTGTAQQVTISLNFGSRFERLIAALRTGDWDLVAHVMEELRASSLLDVQDRSSVRGTERDRLTPLLSQG